MECIRTVVQCASPVFGTITVVTVEFATFGIIILHSIVTTTITSGTALEDAYCIAYAAGDFNTTPPPAPPKNNSTNLTKPPFPTGAKVGIAFGSLAALGLLLGLLFFILRHRRNARQKSETGRSLNGLSELRGSRSASWDRKGRKSGAS